MYPFDEKTSNDFIAYSPIAECQGIVYHHYAKILDDYEKIGVVVNLGGHYVAYFEAYEGLIYYNDLGSMRKVSQIPEPDKNQYHELVFYVKKSAKHKYV